MMPPGSGPGMTHFAKTPAINPTTIKAMMAPMLMRFHLPCHDRHPTANIKQMTFVALLIAGFYPATVRDKLASLSGGA
jgi:hypothetical protein